jgi:hypothetical protein
MRTVAIHHITLLQAGKSYLHINRKQQLKKPRLILFFFLSAVQHPFYGFKASAPQSPLFPAEGERWKGHAASRETREAPVGNLMKRLQRT